MGAVERRDMKIDMQMGGAVEYDTISNSEYGITVTYYSDGKRVLISSICNKLKEAIPQNTWITLTSNIPSVNANFYPQASTISFNEKILSFYITGTEIRVLCRTSGGLAVNDGFSIEMAYIKA